MPKIQTGENPYEKGTPQYKMFAVLAKGKLVTADTLREAAGMNVSNRTLGVFFRDLEGRKYRFTRKFVPDEGQTYIMHWGDSAKGVAKISVEPGSYRERRGIEPKKAATKKAAKKTVASPKAAAKSEQSAKKAGKAPQKAAAASKSPSAAKSTKKAAEATKARKSGPARKPAPAPKGVKVGKVKVVLG